MQGLDTIRDAAWLYVAAPLLGLAGIWLSARLAVPQLRRLASGIRALSAHDPQAEGEVPPSASTWLAGAGSFGAAAAVGAATAVALGGAGAIAWVWLFGLLIAPLRFAEVMLARTDVPGRKGRGETGSLARRLMRERGPLRVVGFLIAALVVVSAFAFVGGVHGAALVDASEQLLPHSMPMIGFGVAAIAALLAVGGAKRVGSIAGWLALAAMIILLGAALWAAASDPRRAVGALGRAIGEAFGGAPAATPFVGALAGEVAMAAILAVLPPLGATSDAAGALHAMARARTTRGQAAAALVAPLAYATLTTGLGMAFVATGAYYHRVEGTVPFEEVRIYDTAFESVSQRNEPERLHTGYMRIQDGEPRDFGLHFGTDQGMIGEVKFTYHDAPADVALQIERGVATRILVPKEGVLTAVEASELHALSVRGEILPRGGALLASALGRGTGGDIAPRLALGALLVLLAVCGAAWGLGAQQSLRRSAPAWARILVGVLPAAGLLLAASGLAPWLGAVGGIAAAALAAITAVALVMKANEVRGLLD